MPSFCRHNRFVQNCPICSKQLEQSAPTRSAVPRQRTQRSTGGGSRGRSSGVVVRKLAREHEDDFRSLLVPGIKASGDAQHLAQEIGFAVGRLAQLAADPPGAFAQVASEPDAEEAYWLAFLTAYLSPTEDDAPFAAIAAAAAAAPWSSGMDPDFAEAAGGPRSALDRARPAAALDAYRAWAQRAGSQEAAFAGEAGWTPERRFDRIFERLAFPGFHRIARLDLLSSLARTGRADVRCAALHLNGNDRTVNAAKRALGIGDAILLERRATELAEACEVPLDALDLALFNWGGEGPRATLGAPEGASDEAAAQRAAAALGL